MTRARVASYNVHGFVGRDGRFDLHRVAEVLREVDADVIGLQEVAADPAHPAPWADLARALGGHGWPGPTLTRSGGPYGNALLSRLPLGAVREIDLAVPGREPRRALIAQLDGCHAVVTHLGLSARERRVQAERLAAAIAPLRRVVVLADANTPFRWSPALRALDRVLGPSMRLPSFPARWPVLPLDRIWAAGVAVTRVWVHRSRLAHEASDHLPVCADLTLPNSALEMP